MKKYLIIAVLIIISVWACFYHVSLNTQIVVEYTDDETTEVKQVDLWTDINPNVDQTVVKVINNGKEELIEIDTRYEKFVHPSSWKYIHVDTEHHIIIKNAFAIYKDSVYKLEIKR